jgi:hypothetical protein
MMGESSKKWTHNELQHDLAEHLRRTRDRLIWEDMQLGPAASPRPDVYSMPMSYSKFTTLAYEIKISTADYRRDVTSGKWQSYLQFAAGVVFAVPAGLVTKEDIPKGCGLIVRHETVWRAAKAPTLHHIETLPHAAWMKLMIDGLNRAHRPIEPRTLNIWNVERKIRQKYGDQIADALRDLSGAEQRLRLARANADATAHEIEAVRKNAFEAARQESMHIDTARRELCEAIGLKPDASRYDITSRCHLLRKRLDANEEVARLSRLFERISAALNDAREPLELAA